MTAQGYCLVPSTLSTCQPHEAFSNLSTGHPLKAQSMWLHITYTSNENFHKPPRKGAGKVMLNTAWWDGEKAKLTTMILRSLSWKCQKKCWNFFGNLLSSLVSDSLGWSESISPVSQTTSEAVFPMFPFLLPPQSHHCNKGGSCTQDGLLFLLHQMTN